MTRRSKRELERAVRGLESDLVDESGVGPTHVVIAGVGREDVDWPEGVTRDDISITKEHASVDPEEPLFEEKVLIPIHLPPEYRGGIVCISDEEIAWLFASMPEDVREAERELRIERGEPIPPILQP